MERGGNERPIKKPKFSYNKLEWKPDHPNRPLWVCPNGRVIFEATSVFYEHTQDFLIAVAEPVRRAELIHEYNLTPESLFAAASTGLETQTIISVLNKLSKNNLAEQLIDFIHSSTANCGKAKLVLKNNRYFVESTSPDVMNTLLSDELVHDARLCSVTNNGKEFEIDPRKVQNIMKRCAQDGLNYPMVEEYDYRNDTVNPNVGMELKPQASAAIRAYQCKSLSMMFGNGRARSGIIVLPCGAGKLLETLSHCLELTVRLDWIWFTAVNVYLYVIYSN